MAAAPDLAPCYGPATTPIWRCQDGGGPSSRGQAVQEEILEHWGVTRSHGSSRLLFPKDARCRKRMMAAHAFKESKGVNSQLNTMGDEEVLSNKLAFLPLKLPLLHRMHEELGYTSMLAKTA